MPDIFNPGIAKHWLNWLVIFSMLLIWAFFFDLVHAQWTNRHPADVVSDG